MRVNNWSKINRHGGYKLRLVPSYSSLAAVHIIGLYISVKKNAMSKGLRANMHK